jgi:hypothetical protein
MQSQLILTSTSHPHPTMWMNVPHMYVHMYVHINVLAFLWVAVAGVSIGDFQPHQIERINSWSWMLDLEN